MAPLCSVNIYKPVGTSRRCQCVVAIVVVVVGSDVPGGDGRLFRLFRRSVTATHIQYIHTQSINLSGFLLIFTFLDTKIKAFSSLGFHIDSTSFLLHVKSISFVLIHVDGKFLDTLAIGSLTRLCLGREEGSTVQLLYRSMNSCL